MRKLLALTLALTLAFAPLVWQAIEVPPAEAQFQAFTQAATLLNAVTALTSSASFDTSGAPIVSFQTVGLSAGGQVVLEGSVDRLTWVALTCYPIGSITGTAVIHATGAQVIVRCNTVGIPATRARLSATGGTVTVKAFATQSYFPLGTNAP